MKRKLLIIIVTALFTLCWNNEMFSQNGPNCPSGVCIGPGGSFSNASLTVTSDTYYSDITINNGKTLIVKSGFTLYVGQVGTPPDTQVVDFQNGCTVLVEEGAFLVVNGKLCESRVKILS